MKLFADEKLMVSKRAIASVKERESVVNLFTFSGFHDHIARDILEDAQIPSQIAVLVMINEIGKINHIAASSFVHKSDI